MPVLQGRSGTSRAKQILHVLSGIVEHQHRPVSELLVDNLVAMRVAEDGLDTGECVQHFGDRKSLREVESIFVLQALTRQALLHVIRGEEGIERVDRVL